MTLFVIDNFIKEPNYWFGVELPAETIERARLLDCEPVVIFHKDTVDVSLMTFSKWGGFVRMGIYAKKVLLFGYKMKIPLEVIVTFLLSHSTMLTIMTFEPGEVTLQSIG